jgi:NodT family efflux transporter outer membrane factor (OMF) lipoprotein
MKAFRKFIGIGLLLFGIGYSGCKTIQPTIDQSDRKSIPPTYAGAKDSTNSADIRWKDFFADKNLTQLIDTALQSNFDVLMTLQRIEMAGNDLRLSQGALLPTVGSNLAYLQRKFGYYTMDDAGNRTTKITQDQVVPTHLPDYFIGLQTNWEVDIWGKLRSKKKAAFSRYLGSVEGKNLVVTNLVSDIVSTYYELLSLDIELDIIRETIKLQQDAFEIVKVQKQVGKINELAVKQFEAQVLNSQSLEFETLQNILENENKLNFLLGRFPQPVIRDKVSFASQFSIQVKEGIPSQLLRNRPDIRQAEYQLLASKFDLKTAKSAFYPSFNITGSLGFQAFNPSFLFTSPQSVAYGFLGGLTTPLLNRSAIKAQFNNAKANQMEAVLNYQKTILNGYVEVSNQLSNIKNLQQIQDRKTKEAAALVQSVDISNELFKSGRASYLDVLIAQHNSLQTRLELVSAQKRQFQATINIYKALGGGWR